LGLTLFILRLCVDQLPITVTKSIQRQKVGLEL
jgi:hypothetical protein